MSRRPLNVWRIHSDLFTNMAGLILTGGLGMMVLFGGAMLRRTPSDDPYPSTCRDLGVIHRVLKDRDFVVRSEGCELTAHKPGIWFKFSNSMPRLTSAGTSRLANFADIDGMAQETCHMAIYSARLVHGRGRVFIEGHASGDVEDHVIEGEMSSSGCVKVAAETYALQEGRQSGRSRPMPYDDQLIDVCNRQISYRRAMNIYFVCQAQLRRGVHDATLDRLDSALGSTVTHDDLMDTIQISSRSTGTPAGDRCKEPSDGVAGDCGRRVSIRVTMSPALGRP